MVQIYELAAVMASLMHFIFLGRRKGPELIPYAFFLLISNMHAYFLNSVLRFLIWYCSFNCPSPLLHTEYFSILQVWTPLPLLQLRITFVISNDISIFLPFRWASWYNQSSKLFNLLVGMVIAKIEFSR